MIVIFQVELGIIFFLSRPRYCDPVPRSIYIYIYYELVSLALNCSVFEAGDVNITYYRVCCEKVQRQAKLLVVKLLFQVVRPSH